MRFRNDLALISSWIKPNSKVLDLGCGDGELLKILALEKANVGTIYLDEVAEMPLALQGKLLKFLVEKLKNYLLTFEHFLKISAIVTFPVHPGLLIS